MINVVYSVSNDTANGVVSIDSLKKSLEELAISSTILSVSFNGLDSIIVGTDVALSTGDKTLVDDAVAAHDGTPLPEDIDKVEVDSRVAFSSKYLPDGRSLFKRVMGENSTIVKNTSGEINHIVTFQQCKFTGAEILGCALKDTVKFKVLDTDQNSYSGLDVGTYGPNVVLNQFGFDVEMRDGGYYSNTSEYDANIYAGMIICCEYKNNNTVDDKYIGVNFELHEVVG